MSTRNFFINLLSSGKYVEAESSQNDQSDIVIRYVLLNSIIVVGVVLVFIFGYENLRMGIFRADIFAMGALLIINFGLLRTNLPFLLPALLSVLPFFALTIIVAITDTTSGSGFSWFFIFPIIAVFLLGLGDGIITSLILFAVISGLLFIPGLTKETFNITFASRTLSIYMFSLALAIMYELTRSEKDKWVNKLNSALKTERDEMVAMKDNLKTGIFIIDENDIIQPLYSQALTGILGEEKLEGVNFLDLLNRSLQKKELNTLKDYFGMVSANSFDAKMLEDINPLNQFAYTDSTGTEKTLAATFTALKRPDGKQHLLCTLEDLTHEAQLEQQLSEEDARRQEEMKSFFEVVHIDPRVLNDFIEETESEFEHINSILKNKELPAKKIMLEMYQGVHAIKSNATIVGLVSFAEKLHKLEDVIRVFTNQEKEISFQDILHVMLELDVLMKVNDSLRGIIEKIKAFSKDDQRVQSSQVLVQTIERVIERICADTGKQAVLSVKHLDMRGIGSEQRRLIKEILVQLTRNALYHGIEQADIRANQNKDTQGTIVLSIDVLSAEKKVRVQLMDDGAGIDFKAISLRARDHNLLSDPAQFADKGALAKVMFMPGFSTASETGMHAGRGVGLSLVHDRIREAGGAIQLQTEEGKGTVFTITLPYLELE